MKIREDGEFGRTIASREHIFADGADVRILLRDLGKLILWNNEQKGYDLDDLIQMVETSNKGITSISAYTHAKGLCITFSPSFFSSIFFCTADSFFNLCINSIPFFISKFP